MKKGNQWLIAIVALVIVGISCKKDQLRSQPANENASLFNDYSNKVVFAKTLAKAVAENPQIRTFIKEEALKQFDKDDDILFQFVKDKKINGQATFYEILMQYADQKEAFEGACNNSPLLTIFVPTLPNLSPEEWNANTQIPQIAVEPNININSGKISIYDAEGKENRLSPELIPAYPVLVIKTNERVVLNNQQDKSPMLPFFSNDQFSFKFLDNVFDGLSSSPDINTRTDLYRPANPINSIDKVNVDAFKSGSEWHRDYVYYGITPTNPTGKYTNRYSEFIRSFKVIKPQDLVLINDHTNDPKPDKLRNSSDPMWTEGLFEFRISALINARNGVGQEYKRYFSARGEDLFYLTYVQVGSFNIYKLESITSREFNPKLEITSWDLEQYGSAWKFAITEYDPSETITKTTTHTSTYSGNFEISLGEIFKIGPKFGASATTTRTTTYQIQTTTGSDDLAEGILDFRSPVITSLTDLSPITQRYYTYEVTTGILSFSVEPKAIY